MLWSDGTKSCSIYIPPSRGKRLVICHAGSGESVVEKSFPSHDDMNRSVLEDWFENLLIPSLPKERKVAIVLDNAKYHSRSLKRHRP